MGLERKPRVEIVADPQGEYGGRFLGQKGELVGTVPPNLKAGEKPTRYMVKIEGGPPLINFLPEAVTILEEKQ